MFVSYGGHKKYSTVGDENVFLLDKDIQLETAVFIKVASYPLLAMRLAHMEMGETVAIAGLGMLGLLGIQLAKVGGARTIFGIGHNKDRIQKAYLCGADYVYNPKLEDVVLSVKKRTQFIGDAGADIVIDTTGNMDALLLAMEYAVKRGRIVITGCNRVSDKPIDIYKFIHKKGLSIIGGHESTRYRNLSAPGNWSKEKDYMVLMQYMKKGLVNPGLFKPMYVSAYDGIEWYEKLINDKDFPTGVVFDWEE